MDLSRRSLLGRDFTGDDLSGKTLAHSDLTGCKFGTCRGTNFVYSHGTDVDFSGADITGSNFEGADESVLSCLIGAVWDGIEITHVSGWITRDYYWCFATNACVQCGCMQKTLEQWQAICHDEESIKVLHDEQPKIDLVAALAWWRSHCDEIDAVAKGMN